MTEPITRETLVSALRRAAQSSRGVRFVDRDEQPSWLSYADLLARASHVAGGLRQLGLERGDRVAIVLPTGPAFFEAFFGAVHAGLVPVPLYPPVRLGRLDEYHARAAAMVRACGARLVLTDRRVRQLLGRTIAQARPELGCLALDEVERCAAEPAVCGADELAVVQFSSGTTVEPKPVRLTHRNILANVAAIMGSILEAYPEGGELTHRGVSWLPLYHDMGLVGCVLAALAHPGELTLIPPEAFIARPALWLRTISRYGGTISPAPNFAYALCVDRINDAEIAHVDLSCWRVALNGAEPVTPAVLARFVERFGRYGFRPEALTPVYGLAEATLAVTFAELGRPFGCRGFDRDRLTRTGQVRELGAQQGEDVLPLVSVGRPLQGCEVRIVDGAGIALAEGQLGTVHVRGPSVMDGYHGVVAQTLEVLSPDGWLDTGDSGFWWEGDLFLYGRAKDLIVVRGRNYAPQDLEHPLDDVEGVRTGCTAAFGVLAAEGERLVVLVERERRLGEEPRALEQLRDAVSRTVTVHSGLVPADVVVLAPGTLPRTSSGKIRRAEAKRQYLIDALVPPKVVTPLRMALEVVRSRIQLARGNRGTP